jgi:hypothetical protein
MSWGVATQNGVSVSLASIVSLSCGATEFSPYDLFTGGAKGAWYDPSDYSTLFQDSAGTTPVTAVEQPVGLMLDKSQGLVLGSELVTNGDFASASGWTLPGTGTNSITGGQAVLSAASGYLLRTGTSITAGNWYRVSFTVSGYSGSGTVRPYIQASPVFGSNVTGNGTFVQYLLATATNASTEVGLNFGTSFTGNIDDISIKSLAGNHALQATSASRPILRARYNLLTYSEQVDNAAWGKTNVTIGSTPVLAPDGTITADLFYPSSTGINRWINSSSAFTAAIYTYSIRAKYSGIRWLYILKSDGSAGAAWFDVQNGVVGTVAAGYTASIATAPNGFYVCTVTSPSTTPNFLTYTGLSSADNSLSVTANGTDGIYIWGADLRTGSSAGTYQRIAAATDYDTAGFLPYLYFVTDDSFGTNSIDFTATDKMSVCAGITKLSDTVSGIVAELSANWNSNTGSFLFTAPSASAPTNDIAFISRGNAAVNINQQASTVVAAPTTKVISALNDIAASTTVLRSNGADVNTATGTKGTGNFGNYPLFIGRRNNASIPFEGRIYQLVFCGKALSASELASTEAYVNSKTGAY